MRTSRSAELTDGIHKGYESDNELKIKKKKDVARFFHNNPCSKLLLPCRVISKQDAGVSCSASWSVLREAWGKSKLPGTSSLLQVGAHGGPKSTKGGNRSLCHWHFSVPGAYPTPSCTRSWGKETSCGMQGGQKDPRESQVTVPVRLVRYRNTSGMEQAGQKGKPRGLGGQVG